MDVYLITESVIITTYVNAQLATYTVDATYHFVAPLHHPFVNDSDM